MEVGLRQLRIRHGILLDIDDDFIMGVDLIRKYEIAYDPEQRILKFGNESVVLSTWGGQRTCVILDACEIVRI